MPPNPQPDPSSVRTPPGRAFRRFLAYTLDYKRLLTAAVCAGLIKFGVSYTFPWLIGSAIDVIDGRDDTVPRLPFGLGELAGTPAGQLRLLIVLGVTFSVIHGVSTFLRGNLAARIGGLVIRDLRQDLFDHLHRLSLHFYAKERTGAIVSRVINDISTASQIVNGGMVAFAMDCFSLTLGFALLFSIDWRLTLATMAVLPFYALTFKTLNPRVKRASSAVQSQLSKISGNVQERLAGIALVKTYAAEGRESRLFREDVGEHYDRHVTQVTLANIVGGVSDGLIHLGQTIVIGYGGYLTLRGQMTPGDVVKFMGWLAVMYLPVRRFAEINVLWQTSLAAIERVFEVFDITPKIVDKPDAPKGRPPHGAVEFRRVRFHYGDDSDETRVTLEERAYAPGNGHRNGGTAPPSPVRWVLDGIDFDVPPGTRVALVGPSGGGKTTLVSLLPRLYDVTEGQILIDGKDVRDYRLRGLRRGIGIVQQESFLFTGTVRENIAYGKPDATDDEVTAAAVDANADAFIRDLPEGYDSVIGERGVTLSGGQRQRLSIARAILKDPRILILDEATSALDTDSESLVRQALERLMAGRTSFIIAHRLGTIRTADLILVIAKGRVVERGTHDDLLTADGLYARLVRQQFGMNAHGSHVRNGPQPVRA